MSAEHGGGHEDNSLTRIITGLLLMLLIIPEIEEKNSEITTALFVGNMHGGH